jgi:type II secretion system protein H
MRPGFTLVEVVTVLVILGLGLAVAAPAFRTVMPRDEVSQLTGDVAAVLRGAARIARTRAEPVTVIMDSLGPRYWVRFGEADSLTSGELSLPPHLRIELPEARTVISFDATGRSTPVEIVVRGMNRTERITVDAWSGDVAIAR